MFDSNDNPISYWIFVLSLFMMSFMVIVDHLMLVPLSSSISKATGLPLEKSGLLVSIYPISAAVSAFIFAPFSDRWGRKKMLLVLTFAFSLTTLGCALSSTAFEILACRVLSGFFAGPMIPNALAFVGDRFKGDQRTRAITVIMLAFSISSIMGVPIGAWLGDTFSWKVPFVVVAVGALASCLVILRTKEIHTGAESGNIGEQYGELISLVAERKVLKLMIIQFFMLIGLFGFVPNLSVWLDLNHQMSTTEIGLCYMQGGIGGLIGNLLSGALMRRGFKAGLIWFGSIVMGIFLTISTMDWISSSAVGFIFAGLMFGGSLRMPALQTVLTEIVPIHLRGRLMAVSVIVRNLTMGFGGIWSIPLLTIDNNHLYGMSTIGIFGGLSLITIPFLVWNLKKDLRVGEIY